MDSGFLFLKGELPMIVHFICSDTIERTVFKRYLNSQLRDSKEYQRGIIELRDCDEKELLLITDMKNEPEIMVYV